MDPTNALSDEGVQSGTPRARREGGKTSLVRDQIMQGLLNYSRNFWVCLCILVERSTIPVYWGLRSFPGYGTYSAKMRGDDEEEAPWMAPKSLTWTGRRVLNSVVKLGKLGQYLSGDPRQDLRSMVWSERSLQKDVALWGIDIEVVTELWEWIRKPRDKDK